MSPSSKEISLIFTTVLNISDKYGLYAMVYSVNSQKNVTTARPVIIPPVEKDSDESRDAIRNPPAACSASGINQYLVIKPSLYCPAMLKQKRTESAAKLISGRLENISSVVFVNSLLLFLFFVAGDI